MKKFHAPFCLVLALLTLLFSGLSASADDPVPKNLQVYLPVISTYAPGTVTLDPQKIGGPGSSLIYHGETYSGPVAVPESALVGIVVNGQAYLYHPSMGENVSFSEATNRLAFIRFWLWLPKGSQAAQPAPDVNSYSNVVLGEALGSLPDGVALTLSTQVTIKRSDPDLTITNLLGRWVAIKVYYKEWGPQVHYLAPAGRYLDSNVIATLGNLKVISHPLLDDASSPCSIQIKSAQVTKIETFGAVYRGVSIFARQQKWPPGSEESWNGPDHDLVLRLNLIDMAHMWIEAVENLGSLITPACLDLLTGLFSNAIETTFLTVATDEERIKMPYAVAMTRDAFWSILKCYGFIQSGMALEVLYTFWDIFVAGGYLVTDHIILPAFVYTSSAYSSEEFYYPPCETTAAPRIDIFVRAKVKGPAGAAVSYSYLKRYCDGYSGSAGSYTGTIGSNGIYLAAMVGSFNLENSQDQILVKATVNGTVKQEILNYNSFGLDGFNLFFPKVAEFVFP
jgi:hypothetical protein